jgi:microcystin-dependent protein
MPATINITNGLYSIDIDFPKNLFDSTYSSREIIVILDNSNPIDTVTIFAPLERDPLLRGYIRDSITWGNVHDKPTIDTSYTNEIQLLSLNGDTLAISDGNSVVLPSLSTVNGKFKVIDTTLEQLVFVSNAGTTTCNGQANTGIWQSFKATSSGKLKQILLPVSESCGGSVIIYLYQGEGIGGQSLGHKSFAVTNTITTQMLELSSGVNSSSNGFVSLIKGNTYTFQVVPSSSLGCFASVSCNNTNPYAKGISSLNVNTDIAFTINIDHSVPSNFTVTQNGHVGIGIDSATTELEVKGRIKDLTGFLMPVGSIISYGGMVIPDGWLLCDGRAVSRDKYADLFEAIGTSWGNPGTAEFNLPDLRGMFLRGVDNSPVNGSSNTDPDRSNRTASNIGGNVAVSVGSKQTDDFKSHTHQERPASGSVWFYAYSTNGTWGNEKNGNVLGPQTGASGGNETRPVNAYVYYIIKY